MHRLSFSIAFLLLLGCTNLQQHTLDSVEQKPLEQIPKEQIPEEQIPLEQIPSKLSVAHFAQMRLSGTGLTLASVIADNAAYTRYSILYQSNGLTISGIMNIPKGDGPFPLVVLNHGYIAPSVYTNGRGLKREQDYLARQGFAVIHPDYRGYAFSDPSPDERLIYDASLEYSMDSANAILAVREANLPSVDATKVGMLGHSLGGGITLNIAVAHPDLIDAVVLYAPVHSDAWENFLHWRDMREEGDNTRAMLGNREDNPEAWDALSSLVLLKNINDPILLFHGTNDESVPKQWSDFLAERLQDLGKDLAYVEYEGEKHEFISRWNDFMQNTAEFLHKHLAQQWQPPMQHASQRITKKPFGMYITPQDSPVEPERFTGYHTGVDFELLPGEKESEVFVQAICSGQLLFKDWVQGYGGVVVQLCTWKGTPVTVLYGHLDLSSVEATVYTALQPGERIGNVGEGYTKQTDGERPHLHLAVHRGSILEFRGYVQNTEAVSDWIHPTEVYR